jgi:cytochrome d ubiquinol oxidase subunit I
LGRIPSMARAFGAVLGILTLVQWASGHDSAQQAAQYQPEKFAAFEGHFEPYGPADLVLVGQPDEETHQTKGIKLPGFASWLLYGKTDQDVIGLDAYNARMQPDWVKGAFQSYHLMVTVGGLLLLFAAGLMIGPVSWLKNLSVWVLPLALFGNLVGWMAAEVGRQPWAIRGILTTEDALGDPGKPLWLLAVSLLLLTGCLGLAVGFGRSLVATRKAIA